MVRGSKTQRPMSQQGPTKHNLPSSSRKISKKKVKNKNEWSKPLCTEECGDDVACSICMENPHNAVLLLCSSGNEGCRPYICATSYRYANCLDRYKKAYASVTGLACPLCRGKVKKWTIDASARQKFDARKRSCGQENCAFTGTYRELRQHMRDTHPLVKPQAVDPRHEEKWKRMEHERDWNDAVSVVMAMMPSQAVVVGDYVMQFDSDNDEHDADDDDTDDDADEISSDGREGATPPNSANIPFPVQNMEHPSVASSESVLGPMNDESSSVTSSRNRRLRRRQSKD